ncbi:hypothetical protein IAR50_006998 [Cryptococcus sp. DSM 104548]
MSEEGDAYEHNPDLLSQGDYHNTARDVDVPVSSSAALSYGFEPDEDAILSLWGNSEDFQFNQGEAAMPSSRSSPMGPPPLPNVGRLHPHTAALGGSHLALKERSQSMTTPLTSSISPNSSITTSGGTRRSRRTTSDNEDTPRSRMIKEVSTRYTFEELKDKPDRTPEESTVLRILRSE